MVLALLNCSFIICFLTMPYCSTVILITPFINSSIGIYLLLYITFLHVNNSLSYSLCCTTLIVYTYYTSLTFGQFLLFNSRWPTVILTFGPLNQYKYNYKSNQCCCLYVTRCVALYLHVQYSLYLFFVFTRHWFLVPYTSITLHY